MSELTDSQPSVADAPEASGQPDAGGAAGRLEADAELTPQPRNEKKHDAAGAGDGAKHDGVDRGHRPQSDQMLSGRETQDAHSGRQDVPAVPRKAMDTLAVIDETGWAPAGHKGGRPFENDGSKDGQVLPRVDEGGKAISYQEWDVNPKVSGVPRDGERLVTGSDGAAYYTHDHYQTFTRIR